MNEYDKTAWGRIPEYGRFMQRKGDEIRTTFAPLFLDFLFRIKGGERLLDVACGAGTMAYLLEVEKVPVEYTGIDITPCYLAMARERFPQHTWVEGDARTMPFADQQFDYTFSVNLLQHLPLPDMRKAVREMCRVTKTAVFIQADFCLVGKEDTVKSSFAEADGTVNTFLYNFTAYDEMNIPGWEWYRVADRQRLIYLISALKGKDHEYVVLERKA